MRTLRSLSLSLALPFALTLAACGAPTDDTGDADELSPTEVAAFDGKSDQVLPKPATDARLYFDTPVTASVSDAAPTDNRTFAANPNESFTLTVELARKSRTNGGSYKLYRLGKSGGKYVWRIVATVDADSDGVAATSFSSRAARVYLVKATAVDLPATITTTLGCDSGDHADCAPKAQPGDLCGTRGAGPCDDGLYCAFAASAQCGATDAGGSCTQKPQICPLVYLPVCGCDGQTYGNTCQAASSGQSVAHDGACSCDPTKWTSGLAGDPTGSWIADLGARYTYTLASDGTFTSRMEPACLFAPTPCRIAVQEKRGTWALASTTLKLTYSTGTVASFATQHNCAHDDRLSGSDYGTTLTLARVE